MESKPRPENELCFDTEGLSERWKIPVNTLRYWRTQRIGPPWVKFGRPTSQGALIRYRLTDVLEYEEQMKIPTYNRQ